MILWYERTQTVTLSLTCVEPSLLRKQTNKEHVIIIASTKLVPILVQMTIKTAHLKPRTDEQFFLDKFLDKFIFSCACTTNNFSLTGVHTNKFPGWKAGMTSFSTRLLVKKNLSIFSRTHEQIKLVSCQGKIARQLVCTGLNSVDVIWA